ncbi:MAG: HAMP domain-containing protein [Anaerolineaceae bacterium]|nr:MAG: HAMP domain-containing protein [Anaerolineaceae bacterium]
MKKNWWRSLRVKIIAWSFVPTVIILSAVAWFTFYSYQKVLGDLAIKQDLAVVDTKTEQVAPVINNLFNASLQPIILNIDTKPELPREVRAQNILDHAPNLDVLDGGIYFVDQHGIVFKSQPEQPELIGKDWSDTHQFRYVRDNPPGAGPITDIRFIGADEAGIVCAIWPMHNTLSEFIGASYYCLAINPNEQSILYTTVNSLSLGQNVYILDGNQRIIFSPDLAQLGKDLSKEASIQQLLQSENKSIRFKNGMGDRVISYSSLVRGEDPNTFWILVSEQRWNEIMQPTLPYRRLLLVMLALGVIVPVLVTAYGVRHITNPIQNLIQASEQVTAGQFQQRIDVNTGDEIETLADQFNLMSAKLDDSYSSLEKKVADRTQELAILNSIISVASHSLDIEEILGDALDKTLEQMGFDAGTAFRLESDPTTWHLVAHRGIESTTALDLSNIDPIASQVNEAGYQSMVTTFKMEDFQDEIIHSQMAQSELQMLVYVPLSTRGRDMGFFLLGKRELSALSTDELSLLNSIGQQIGVAMENAYLYEQAQQTAITGERSRLARELHDAVTQTLFSANLIADVIPRIWKRNPEEGLQNLEELRQLTRGALAEMRTMLLEMRPESLERADIKTLLTQLADAFIGRVRVPLNLEIHGDCELTHEVKIAFYRIAQEALNNIAKHSGAQQVDLHLECQPGQLKLCIKDDGLGFEFDSLPPGHMGIAIMRERASSIGASLKIESQIGQGTTVELDWRLAQKG